MKRVTYYHVAPHGSDPARGSFTPSERKRPGKPGKRPSRSTEPPPRGSR